MKNEFWGLYDYENKRLMSVFGVSPEEVLENVKRYESLGDRSSSDPKNVLTSFDIVPMAFCDLDYEGPKTNGWVLVKDGDYAPFLMRGCFINWVNKAAPYRMKGYKCEQRGVRITAHVGDDKYPHETLREIRQRFGA